MDKEKPLTISIISAIARNYAIGKGNGTYCATVFEGNTIGYKRLIR